MLLTIFNKSMDSGCYQKQGTSFADTCFRGSGSPRLHMLHMWQILVFPGRKLMENLIIYCRLDLKKGTTIIIILFFNVLIFIIGLITIFTSDLQEFPSRIASKHSTSGNSNLKVLGIPVQSSVIWIGRQTLHEIVATTDR